MLNALFGIAVGVYAAAKVVKFLSNQLSAEEQRKQDRIRSEYNAYRRTKEAEYEAVHTEGYASLTDLANRHAAERAAMRQAYRERQKELNRPYFDSLIAQLNEHRDNRRALQQEVSEMIQKSWKVKQEDQMSVMRGQSLEQLRQNLEEAAEKVKAYLNYLDRYERNLRYHFEKGHDLPAPFDYLLPDDYPYIGQLLFRKKSDLASEGRWEVAPGLHSDYHCPDFEQLNDFDEDAVVPLFVERFESKTPSPEGKPRYYVLSCAKGLFKYTALYQPGVGVEATVARHESHNLLLLDYRGLPLKLYTDHLENPRRKPPRGTKLRIFPLRTTYKLKKEPLVTERYHECFSLHHFDDIPLVFDPGDYDEFAARLDELHLWDSTDEWKIAPLDEAEVPETERLKLQLGTELLLQGKIVSADDGRSHIQYEKLLPLEQAIKPDHVFVAASATLKVLWADEMHLIEEADFTMMNQFCWFLFQEFKLQKSIKESQAGIAYFNKWAAVTDDLITYLYKGPFVYCETERIVYAHRDKKLGVDRWFAPLQNEAEVETFLRKTQQNGYGRSYYFIETSDGRYLPVEFKLTGNALTILGEYEASEGETLKVYQKQFPYPEIQQKNALNVFREGRLANAKLKPYFLNAANVETSRQARPLDTFYNERVATNASQREAVELALAEENFYMIQGPPGTGKTTVIKEIILQHLARRPQDRVLVVSQANVAVDNVLKDLYVDFKHIFGERDLIRCGKNDKIDEEILPISFEQKYEDYQSKLRRIPETPGNRPFLQKWRSLVDQGQTGRYNSDVGELILKGHRIVGATCVGLAQKNIGLDRLVFDLVIIDEGSKALPAEILIPVNRARKVLLIGDHKQLPPTVNTALFDPEKIDLDDREYVQEEMFAKSLFQRLFEACPDSNKSMLRTQYRMPAVLGQLVSRLFYEDRLESGAPTYRKAPVYFHKNLNWLDMSRDATYREEKINGMALVNKREADIVYQLIQQMRRTLPLDKRIAVITPYKGQRKEILRRFWSRGENPFEQNVAVNTIDAFQGDEAHVVIYCTTRSKQPTNFFADEARLNVALSRSMADLLIVGSIRYFERYGEDSPVSRIARYIREHGAILTADSLQDSQAMQEAAASKA